MEVEDLLGDAHSGLDWRNEKRGVKQAQEERAGDHTEDGPGNGRPIHRISDSPEEGLWHGSMPRRRPATDPMSPDAFLDELVSIGREVSRRQPRHLEGRALAEAVRQVSHAYTRDRATLAIRTGSDDALSARLQFFMPRDAPKIWGPLSELHARGVLPIQPRYRIIDVGAGTGATTVGTIAFLRAATGATDFEVTAIDRWGPGLRAMRHIVNASAQLDLGAVHLECLEQDFEALNRLNSPSADLIVFGFALNELSDHDASVDRAHRLLRAACNRLTKAGAVVVMEPALRHTARWLQTLRDAVAQDPNMVVFAPCTHHGPCPLLASENDWCHEDRPGRLPDGIVDLARQAGLRYERLTFAYLTVRRSGASTLAESDDVSRVVSQPLVSKGKRELILCGAHGRVRATRLNRHATATNRAFTEARRGDLLRGKRRAARRKGPSWSGRADTIGDLPRPARP